MKSTPAQFGTLRPSLSLAQSNTRHSFLQSSAALVEHDVSASVQMPPKAVCKKTKDDTELLKSRGYRVVKELSTTLQGQLYKAERIKAGSAKSYVAIKRTSKRLHSEQIAMEEDSSFFVAEDIVKEAAILKYLTVDNTPLGGYIAGYVDFFESQSNYYLVMEYVASEINLRQFIRICRRHIKRGQLKQTQYQHIMKYLLWQLFVTVIWCHKQNCAHLDLCTENIMLKNGALVRKTDGTDCMSIDTKICVQVADFGVSEVFRNSQPSSFSCNKFRLSLVNECYLAPDVYHARQYDARCADVWSLGIIMFECMTLGTKLYTPFDMRDPNGGYNALHKKTLKVYCATNRLLQYFDDAAFDLMDSLLNVNAADRIQGLDVLRHPWFAVYFKRYRAQLQKKFANKVPATLHLPFYHLNRFP